SISARGGAQAGNGGNVETSGHYLDMQGQVDTRAPKGATGNLLLDPTNVFIANSQTNAAGDGMLGTDVMSAPPFTPLNPVPDSLVLVGTLQGYLATTNITIQTANGSGSGTGFIRVVDPILWGSSFELSLQADNGITINGSITGGPGSTLGLHALGGNITQGPSANIVVPNLFAKADTGSVTLTNPGNSVTTLAGFATAAPGFSFVNL